MKIYDNAISKCKLKTAINGLTFIRIVKHRPAVCGLRATRDKEWQ